MNPLPLLTHSLSEPTAFTPEALLSAVCRVRGLANEAAPPVCVLDFDGDLTDILVAEGRVARRETWPCSHTPMYSTSVDQIECGIIPRTIGGPYAVLVAEQLATAGTRLVVGPASAGRVLPTLPFPSLVIATSAVRDEGTSFHYLAPGDRVDAPASIPDYIESELLKLNLTVSCRPVRTTDAPYRETRTQLAAHAASGVLAAEM